MEAKTNRELTEEMLALETYTKVYLPKQLKDADAKIEETDARIPDTTSEDAGKFIGVDSNGDLAAVEAVSSLPAVTADDNGSFITVQSGTWKTAKPVAKAITIAYDSDAYKYLASTTLTRTNIRTSYSSHKELILSGTITRADQVVNITLRSYNFTQYYQGSIDCYLIEFSPIAFNDEYLKITIDNTSTETRVLVEPLTKKCLVNVSGTITSSEHTLATNITYAEIAEATFNYIPIMFNFTDMGMSCSAKWSVDYIGNINIQTPLAQISSGTLAVITIAVSPTSTITIAVDLITTTPVPPAEQEE